MKQGNKLALRMAAGLFVLGFCLRVTGAAMGGRTSGRKPLWKEWDEDFWTQGFGPIQVTSAGVMFGGENGIFIDSDGVHFGNGADGGTQRLESGVLTGITALDVDVDCADIWVQKGENVSVTLSWNLYTYAMDYRVEDGVLKVESAENWGGVWEKEDNIVCQVLITLPAETELEEMELSTDFGDITLDVEQVMAQEAELSTELGDISSVGLTAYGLKAESDLGDVAVHFPVGEDLGYCLSTGLGTVQVNTERYCYQDSSEISYKERTQKYFVEASSDLGDVTLLFNP